MSLRPYQTQMIDDARTAVKSGHKHIVLALPTGGGKTHLAGAIAKAVAQKGKRLLFAVDRIVLIQQAANHFKLMGLNVGILQGENTNLSPANQVIVASIQTLNARRAPPAEFVIIDEVHLLHKAHIKLMKAWSNIIFIGLSATPINKLLGRYFTKLIRGASIQQLINDGYLVRSRAFCPSQQAMIEVLTDVPICAGEYKKDHLAKAVNTKKLVADIPKTWLEKANNRKTLAFGVDVPHSKAICESFLDYGIHAMHIDGDTPPDERLEIINQFEHGDIQILCSCNVLSIGFDVPVASCAILARPTLSEALYIQQCGRVLRPAEGKQDALLLDHAGNCLRFGLPDDFIAPDLCSDAKDKITPAKRKKLRMLSVCRNCNAVIPRDNISCPECGHDRPIRQADVTYHDSNLVELNSKNSGKREYTADEKLTWLQAFAWIAGHSKSGKVGAGYYSYKDKFNEEPPVSIYNVTPMRPTKEISNWITSNQIRRAKIRQKIKRQQAIPKQCPTCQSNNIVIQQGKPPHAKQLRCGDCNHFQWLPKYEGNNYKTQKGA